GHTTITEGYHQTNRKTDTGKTLKRWPVLVDHFTKEASEPWSFVLFDESRQCMGRIESQQLAKSITVFFCHLVG
ncbi:hypothetical protein, partial [Lonsdalea quercina]|uniref:hypothetical protein n=1 Tax=Lonsdalea quercina TaxID=71657 RepID=UPI00397513B4